jgi:hypothetical protein
MISITFETSRFRVQIVGKSAWVESNDGVRWIFSNQHSLPLAPGVLQMRDDSTTMLRLAVDHFESTYQGDLALREALTGVRHVPKLEISKGPAVRSNPSKPPPRLVSKRRDFPEPLRPPLGRP